MNILFFPMGNMNTPSSRIRAFGFAKEIRNHGINTKVLGATNTDLLSTGVIGYFLKFIQLIILLPWADIVFFQKTSHFSTYFCAVIVKKFGKKIVYDIDDSIHIQRRGKWVDKFIQISDMVTAGSNFLLDHAIRINKNSYKVPTPIDMRNYSRETRKFYKKDSSIVIGWIGLPFNLRYLKIVKKPLEILGRQYNITVRIITDTRARNEIPDIKNVNIDMVKWSLGDWLDGLRSFDIGIMPLENNDWTKGKCAFKGLEYMSQRIPVVGSNVGESKIAIENGKSGFLVTSEKEWVDALGSLINDEELRKTIGENGYERVISSYTLEKVGTRLAKLLHEKL